MTSVRITNPNQGDAHSAGTGDGSARLSLKPKGSVRGVVDGAWWPRSTDPAIELTILIDAVGVPVRRIALNMTGWVDTPCRIRRGSGQKVAVDWFRISGVHLVRIVGTGDQRIDLLVIPVNTEEATAELVLAKVTEGHDPDIAATVGDHSAPVGPPANAKASPGTTTAPYTAMPTTGLRQLIQRRRKADADIALLRCSGHG